MTDITKRLRETALIHNRGPNYEPLRVEPGELRLEAAAEIERLRTELGRAYRALHGYAYAERQGGLLSKTAVAYHASTVGAAARWVREGAMDGAEYFIGKPVEVLHEALRD